MATSEHPQLNRLILLMVSGLTGPELTAAASRLEIPESEIGELIDEARQRIRLAASFDHHHELGVAYTRLNDLYIRAIKVADLKTALTAQRDLNRLLESHTPSSSAIDPLAVEVDAREEVEAIRLHLLPLQLASPSAPLREHARIAAERIRQQSDASCQVPASASTLSE
ncbi:unnamed protein product [Tuwongella immobilis]|uniref:Uncharacterized protein n=1 Tax=Tuwongella immobilis TaxID=692036 RepID=A0A6C2YQN8_9BACT|nr:unnamed protein product [Tuwongella immobilis]VTS05283.1 unnamed protein product [Tuwongella immobilis]